MRQACVALIVMFVGVLAGGCSSDPYARYNLGASRDVVAKSIDAIGGLNDWQKVQTVRAVALVTSYDSAGTATVDRIRVTMDFCGQTIQATGMATQGEWSAKAEIDGHCDAKGPAPAAITSHLATILHRTQGPLNLLHGDKANCLRRARVNGIDVDRVCAAGPNGQRVAYYFDAVTGLLRFLTAGDEKPRGQGTVTIYGKESYVTLPSRLVFPRKLRVMKVGQDTLIGETPVLEVEFSEIRTK